MQRLPQAMNPCYEIQNNPMVSFQQAWLLRNLQHFLQKMLVISYQPGALHNPEIQALLAFLQGVYQRPPITRVHPTQHNSHSDSASFLESLSTDTLKSSEIQLNNDMNKLDTEVETPKSSNGNTEFLAHVKNEEKLENDVKALKSHEQKKVGSVGPSKVSSSKKM